MINLSIPFKEIYATQKVVRGEINFLDLSKAQVIITYIQLFHEAWGELPNIDDLKNNFNINGITAFIILGWWKVL